MAAFAVQRSLPFGRLVSSSSFSIIPVLSSRWVSSSSSSCRRMMSSVSGADMMASFGNDKSFVGTNVEKAMESLAKADAVCFDVDSTVIAEEGIDVLADYLGKGQAVAELTAQAMEGSTKFQDALRDRLELLKPSKGQIEQCLIDRPLVLSEGIQSLVQSLKDAGKDVFLVSGGFRIMIEPFMETDLGLDPVNNLYANTVLFDEEGTYTGFDDTEPTSADMGKPKALSMIKEEHKYETMVMVGDGATDAQAKPPADAFIGFGGVVVRQKVEEAACWFVTDFADMEHIVKQYA